MSIEPVIINGIKVYPFDSVAQILHYVDEHKGILVAANAEKLIKADDCLREIMNANIGYCDGSGAVYGVKKKGGKNACKIAGCELWLHIVERFHKIKTFYLVGAKPEVIDAVVSRLKKEYPAIKIVGYRDGYVRTDEERQALIDDISDKRPDVVFVAMGSPKQELLMADMQKCHSAIYQGLGGSFDIYAGILKRAPQWWLDHNLETAYRLIKEPKRIKRDVYKLKFMLWLWLGKI